tara:strand:+ start:375 stop:917 length:543 start_codon:yes stop_codon:yes gene_type:complete
MKNYLLIFFISFTCFSFSQNEYWQLFSDENIQYIKVSKSGTYKLDELTFKIMWDNKLSHSENIGYYGGIKTLTVYKNSKEMQTLINIEDNIALGTINFDFYDYNLDGFIDFTLPINCGKICWKKYYLFNPELNKFEHKKDWDYLRVQKIDKKNKLIMTQPDGMVDNRKTYQIKGNQLIEI